MHKDGMAKLPEIGQTTERQFPNSHPDYASQGNAIKPPSITPLARDAARLSRFPTSPDAIMQRLPSG